MKTLSKHFGLDRIPFSRQIPPEGLLLHRGFEEAKKRLLFTVELDGIATLVSEPGCGKSILLGVVAQELQTASWVVHYLAHSSIGPFGLINMLARKIGRSPRRSRGETAMVISEALLEDDRRVLLILDEAHEFPDATLEDIRLLTIADFDTRSPFILVLAGQPLLDERLAEPTHYALDQRITTVARLHPLSADEIGQYIDTRLSATGAKNPVFDDAAVEAIFDSSGGVPRRINNLATASMIVAASRGKRLVGAQEVHDARMDRAR